MNNGHKSAIVKMHNRGMTIQAISEKTGLAQLDVKAFLMTRVNYPNIIPANGGSDRRYRAERVRDSDHGVVRPVTLPRLRFLDGAG